jgi:predicted permease
VARHRELSVRSALGASRGRLVAQMLTESFAIACVGTLAGYFLASWASVALADFVQKQIYIVPAQLNLSMDWRILSFTAVAAVLTAIACGLVPAWRASKRDVNSGLRQSPSILAGTSRLGKKLMVIEVALSVILLASAGLFLRSLAKLRSVEPGFRTRELLQIGLFPRPNGYKNVDLVDYYHSLTDRISSLPGVISAGLVHTRLGNVLEWTEAVRIRGVEHHEQRADFELVTPGFFQAAGIDLLRGRTFDWQDNQHHPTVAIVTTSFAEQILRNSNGIGSHFDVTSMPNWQNLEIVGIVSDTSLYDMHKSRPPTVYLPAMQYGDYMGWSEILVHTVMPPAIAASAISGAVDSFGHEYVTSVRTIRQDLDRSILQERVTAMLAGFFGVAALLLGTVGLYGLMAYSVRQRIPELGVRAALGATTQGLHRMVLRETLLLTVSGLAIGLPCALGLNRLLANLIFGVSFYDPVNLLLVMIVLLTVALCAGYLPARQATRVDPIVALRSL